MKSSLSTASTDAAHQKNDSGLSTRALKKATKSPELALQIADNLYWRQFESPLKKQTVNHTWYDSFEKKLVKHLIMTQRLRKLENKYYKQVYSVTTKGNTPEDKARAQMLWLHWDSIGERANKENINIANNNNESLQKTGIYDEIATTVKDKLTPLDGSKYFQTFGNISVTNVPNNEKLLVYSNTALNKTQEDKIEQIGKEKGKEIAMMKHPLHGAKTEIEKLSFGHKRLRYPSGQIYDLALHSELHRDLHPRDFQSTGNNLRACPQCAAAYHAYGYSGKIFGGAHQEKAPSVIPPQIRNSSVYLQQYLGKEVFRDFKTTLLQEGVQKSSELTDKENAMFEFLNAIEGMDKKSYKALADKATSSISGDSKKKNSNFEKKK